MLEPSLPNEALIRGACFAGVFVAMALWERGAPRRRQAVARRRRWPGNLGIVALDTLLLRVALPVAAVGVALAAEARGWGLLRLVELPWPVAAVLGVVALDLVVYLQHVLFHAVPALWRLHRVHHADLEIDVTTGLRFHPLEILLSMGLKMAAVAALGPPVAAVVAFEVLLNASSMFNHGNVALPLRLDRWLRLLVVTPDMHRVHHSVHRDEHSTNYGFNLSCWDRLLGTYRAQPRDGHEGMTIGLEQFRDERELRLGRLLAQPWRRADR
jgi:sterol desaturase/sphingolipid hydroxylase (fatty acid hydroxylase superfamily)